jgi:hypothetical protein
VRSAESTPCKDAAGSVNAKRAVPQPASLQPATLTPLPHSTSLTLLKTLLKPWPGPGQALSDGFGPAWDL